MDENFQQMIERYKSDLQRFHAAHPDTPQAATPAPAQPAQPLPTPPTVTPTLPDVPPVETPQPTVRPDYPAEMPTGPIAQPEIPTIPMPVPESNVPRPQNDRGYIQVRTYSASEATPVPDALVLILQEGQPVRQTLTDRDGLTELIPLDTVGRALSMTEGNAQPYTPYDVQITAEGYLPVTSLGVPVFGGVTAIQNVALIPRPEFGQYPGEVFENPEPEL